MSEQVCTMLCEEAKVTKKYFNFLKNITLVDNLFQK